MFNVFTWCNEAYGSMCLWKGMKRYLLFPIRAYPTLYLSIIIQPEAYSLILESGIPLVLIRFIELDWQNKSYLPYMKHSEVWLTWGFLVPSFPWKTNWDGFTYPPYPVSLSPTPGKTHFSVLPPHNTWIYFEIQKAAPGGIYALATEKDVIKGTISLKKNNCEVYSSDGLGINKQNPKFPLSLVFVQHFTTERFLGIAGTESIFPIIPESSLVQKVLWSGLVRMLAWVHGSFTLKT